MKFTQLNPQGRQSESSLESWKEIFCPDQHGNYKQCILVTGELNTKFNLSILSQINNSYFKIKAKLSLGIHINLETMYNVLIFSFILYLIMVFF